MTRPTLGIAGGGTGGHVFPAVAVAEALDRLADVDVVFFGSDRGIEARVVPARGWRFERLDAEPLKGGGPARALRGGIVAARSTLSAFDRVRLLRPRAVLGVGGYASGPVCLASALLGVPLAVLEPNGVPGLANRLLGPFARRAYLAWPEAVRPFRRAAARFYGVPLRAGFIPRPYVAGDVARVLVMGGSQGAAALDERLPEAMGAAGGSARVEILHQAGRAREAAVREDYARRGVAGVTVVSFIDDVAAAIAEADVIVARAGASTIAEVTAIGRASVLVPFPYAADDHQARNAAALASRGGAVRVLQHDATPARLASEIGALLSDGRRRATMADAARACGRPDAATGIALDLLDLASIPLREASHDARDAHGSGHAVRRCA